MIARLIAAFAVLAVLVGYAFEQPRRRASSPSRLERSCFFAGNWLPCHIMDEALQTEWHV